MSPQHTATWQKAIELQLSGKIDVLEVYEATVSSAGNRYELRPPLVIQLPAVARLRKADSPYKNRVKFSRVNMLARDGYRCCYCGERKTARELTYDHVMPRSRWKGPLHEMTSWKNVVMACKPCNRRKGDRTPREAGMKMHFKPYVPEKLPLAQPLIYDVDNIPECWRPYLDAALAQAG
jgi:5-methylcytosine-specific restriction endonuclease McrA